VVEAFDIFWVGDQRAAPASRTSEPHQRSMDALNSASSAHLRFLESHASHSSWDGISTLSTTVAPRLTNVFKASSKLAMSVGLVERSPDLERKQGNIRGPLHRIPIVLKAESSRPHHIARPTLTIPIYCKTILLLTLSLAWRRRPEPMLSSARG